MNIRLPWLFLAAFLTATSCAKDRKIAEKPQSNDTNAYVKFPVANFRHLKINCVLGRLNVQVYQRNEPQVAVHESFRKYVNFEERGDSLIVYTVKSPPATKEKPVQKNIRLFVPDLDSYDAEISQTDFIDFRTKKLDVALYNDYFRLFNCGVADLKVITDEACNVVIDQQNIILKATLTLNEESYLTFKSPVRELVLIKKSPNNVRLVNVPPKNFTWIK